MQTSAAGNAAEIDGKAVLEGVNLSEPCCHSRVALYGARELRGHLLVCHRSARGLCALRWFFIFSGELSVLALLLAMLGTLFTDLGVFG